MTVATYSLASQTIVFGGATLEGFAEGDGVIAIAQQGDSITEKVGAAGDIVIQHTPRNLFLVTLQLLGTSRANAVLTAAHALGLAGGAPFMWRDTLGADLFTCPVAWIKKHPDRSQGASAATLSWVFSCPGGVLINGGTAQ